LKGIYIGMCLIMLLVAMLSGSYIYGAEHVSESELARKGKVYVQITHSHRHIPLKSHVRRRYIFPSF